MHSRLSPLAILAAAGLLAMASACSPRPGPTAPSGSAAEPAPAPAPAPVPAPEPAPAAQPEPAPGHAHHAEPAHGHAHGHAHGAPAHGAPAQAHGHAQPDDIDSHPHVNHRFDDPERYARSFDNPQRNAWQKPAEVVELLALAPGQTVVDIGAGTGYFLPHLAPAVQPGGQAVGLDVEPAMVEHMTRRIAREKIAGAQARQGAPDDPGLAPASVDRVLTVNTWHHIAERVAYARKLHQALRPGGFVLVVDYTMTTKRGPPPAARIAPERVIDELTQAGFTAELVKESLPHQYIVRGSKR
jgi:predicted methyltransferase